MRNLLLLIFLSLYSLQADEIQRIESIVEDIEHLRNSYSKAQDEILMYKYEIHDLEEKNKILKSELESINEKDFEREKEKKKIISLENQVKKLENSVKTKEKENKILIRKNSILKQKCLKNQIKKDENQFPPLALQKKYIKKEQKPQNITYFKATAFRVNKNAPIYDAIDGKVIDTWEEKTSFTSNQRSEQWVKITGYFVNKVWQAATHDMWVKSEDVFARGTEQ